MSQLMKSLELSEQQYRIRTGDRSTFAVNQPKKPIFARTVTALFIALVPPICAVTYLGYQTYMQWQIDYEQASNRIANKKEQESLMHLSQANELDYPEFSSLRKLRAFPKASVLAGADEASVSQDSVSLSPQGSHFITPKTSLSTTPDPDSEIKLDALDLSGLSPELAQKVQQAWGGDIQEESSTELSLNQTTIKLVENELRFIDKLPAMDLQTHMYASSAARRWVKINGQELKEGEWLDGEIEIIEITPRNVVIGYQGERVEIPALYTWQG